MKIIDNIHLIPNVQANFYLIIEPNGLTIIDTEIPFRKKWSADFGSLKDFRSLVIQLGCKINCSYDLPKNQLARNT